MASVSKENYLKIIFYLKQHDVKPVSTSEIANELEISNAATSEMAKKLSESGLISYKKYKGIDLTPKGKKVALGVIRKHRLWELFLANVLGLSWAEVHDEAEKLEHISSEKLIDKIDEFLGFPEFDPHGDPIPKKNGKLPKLTGLVKLSEGKVGGIYNVIKVNDLDNELMNYLTRIGVKLYKQIEIVEKLIFDKSIIVKIDNHNINLSEKIANSIYITQLKNAELN